MHCVICIQVCLCQQPSRTSSPISLNPVVVQSFSQTLFSVWSHSSVFLEQIFKKVQDSNETRESVRVIPTLDSSFSPKGVGLAGVSCLGGAPHSPPQRCVQSVNLPICLPSHYRFTFVPHLMELSFILERKTFFSSILTI